MRVIKVLLGFKHFLHHDQVPFFFYELLELPLHMLLLISPDSPAFCPDRERLDSFRSAEGLSTLPALPFWNRAGSCS